MSRIGAAAAAAKRCKRIEDAAIERHQRDQQQIGKGDAGEIDREREAAAGRCAKPGASRSITAGVNSKATASSTIWLASSSVKMRSANSAAAFGPALLADAGIGRHEGGVEGAFGEDGAEMIGQPQRDEEGIGHRPGAEHRGQHDVADKAGDPRQQRQPPTVRMRSIIDDLA